jgi:amino acid adenylation domain-containing protein
VSALPPASSESGGHGPRACVLVGEGNVLIGAAELLRTAGLTIGGVVSDDPPVVRWARELGLAVTGHGPQTVEWLRQRPHDYLLSVFNLQILPVEMIRLPRIAALNYHDAVLPRFAGLHATSWALINGEQSHGVTWHLIDAGIDTGAVVAQRAVAISEDDTALSLNVKCSAAALEALSDLIPDLIRGSITADPQDLNRRTYFAGSKRPAAAGILDWERPAEEIDALIRGCDFGPYFNPLVLPKLWTGVDCLLVAEVVTTDGSLTAPPGTVISVSDGELVVATATRPVTIGELRTIDGQPLSIAGAAERYDLRVGHVLPRLTPQQVAQVTALTESMAPHERFWRGRLQSVVPVAPLRGLQPAEAETSGDVVSQAWQVPDEMDAWLAGHSWTREEFLLAACGAFLGRLHFQDTFDVELVRHDDAADALPPLFATRVPFRFNVGDDFESLLQRVREEMARIARHQRYPRDLVSRSPELRRQLAAHPVTLILGDAAVADEAADLVIQLPIDGDEGVIASDRLLFATVPALAERFSEFVRSLTIEGGALGRVSLTSSAERAVLALWGTGPDAAESDDCVHHLFEAQAARTPTAIAVRCGVSEMTYRELDLAADRLAARLRGHRVDPDLRVGVCLGRSLELIVAMLGILKAGGAYVPLDPAYPRRRLGFIADDSGLHAIVTDRRHAQRLPSGELPLVYLDDDEDTVTAADPVVRTNVSSSACAYVIYTSGSTGEPKGVEVEHHSVVNFIRAAQSRYRLTPDDRVLQFASVSFDASVEEIFPCLSSGATLVLRTDEMVSSAADFMNGCAEFGITVLDLPTAYWHTLVAQLPLAGRRGWPSLRLVIIGGEKAFPGSPAAWRELVGPGVELINTYGPTEATVVSTWADVSDCAEGDVVPIGTPIPGVTVHVLDPWGQPVPSGVPGQLHVGGAGIARGYLNRPDLSAERFLRDAAGATLGEWLYRTGDLCRWRPGGMLEFLGRIDDQVKVRGYRIELSEIEAVLNARPDVANAVVVVSDRDILRACIVPQSAGSVDRKTLRAALAERLPDWMVPADIVVSDELPTLTNGKIDRRALVQSGLEVARMRASAEYGGDADGPRTLLEMVIIEIWKSLFGREDIGRDDNFFDLGGHSLLAVQFLDELEHRVGYRVAITTLFQMQTVGLLSRALTNSSSMPAWTSLVPLQPAGARRPLFVVHGLKGVVFAYTGLARLISPDQPVYGLQAVGIDEEGPRHTTVKDMAAHYIREIRGLQPEGPYLLAGFSLGGWFAYEMAAQLRGAGQQVTIFVVDSHPVCLVPWQARGAYGLVKISLALCGARNHLPRLASLPIRLWPRYATEKIKKLIGGLFGPSGQRTPLSAQPRPVSFTFLGEPTEDYYTALARRHSQRVADVRVELFLAKEPLAPWLLHAAQTLLWRLLARGGLRVHRLPCHHVDILSNPHIAQLAETVDRVLAAQAQTDSFRSLGP